MAVTQHALTRMSKGQIQGRMVTKATTVAWLLIGNVFCGRCSTAADEGVHVVWLFRFSVLRHCFWGNSLSPKIKVGYLFL